MTVNQKQAILHHRAGGMSFSRIAKVLGLSTNTVKSYYRRTGSSECGASNETDGDVCKHCGQKLRQIRGAKQKKFCGDKCRLAWWNTHRDQLKRQAFYPMVCVHCGRSFESYGNAGRKYCSHKCYIAHRFRKAETA